MTPRKTSPLRPPVSHAAPAASTSYWVQSIQPWVILLALLPLIVICEVGLATWPSTLPPVQVTAHRHLLNLFSWLALPPPILLAAGGIVTVVILLVWQSFTNTPWRARPRTLAWMYFEGLVMALPLLVIGRLLLAPPLAAGVIDVVPDLPWMQRVVLSIAAGLYEELLFRMVLIAAVHAVLVDIGKVKDPIGLGIAVVISAAAFAWYHDPGTLTTPAVVFTALAGLYLGVLYLVRGFGIVVLAHIAYDIIVMLQL